jgi:hypothetical protein
MRHWLIQIRIILFQTIPGHTASKSKLATRTLYACVSSSSWATKAFALVAQVSSFKSQMLASDVEIIKMYTHIFIGHLNIFKHRRNQCR